MNTSESPPDGVYWRSNTQMSTAVKVTGFGIFKNDKIEATCYRKGEKVGAYGNDIWYYAKNVTRPSVSGRGNEGYVNTHFVNDGMPAGKPHKDVPNCDQPQPTKPKEPVGFYASPYPKANPTYSKLRYSQNTLVVGADEGIAGPDENTCAQARTVYDAVLQRAAGAPIGWMASWSQVRFAPLYFLSQATPEQKRALKYILMIDPGSRDQMAKCGEGATADGRGLDAGAVLADWLNSNPDARLVIIAGQDTVGRKNPLSRHEGINVVLFNDVRWLASSKTDHVSVCSYYGVQHNPDSFKWSEWYIERPITSVCPQLGEPKANVSPSRDLWHP